MTRPGGKKASRAPAGPVAPGLTAPDEPSGPARSDRSSRASLSGLLLSSPAGGLALSLAFLALSLSLSFSQRYLHAESVFTIDLARLAADAPAPLFFFQKAKPVLMAVYVLPSALGLRAFLVVHAALGAAAVYLVIAAARRLGLSAPNVAGWALAGSASFTIAASNGYPNSDGAFFVALFLFLHASGRRVAAPLVLGALPFVRTELAAVTLVFAAWDLATRRDPRFLGAVLALPIAYAIAGAIYHRDLFWLYSEFPNPGGLPAAIRVHRAPSPLEALRNLRGAVLTNAPTLAVFGVAAFARRDRRLLPLIAAAGLVYLGMTLLQVADLFGFDTSPRYYVAAMPLCAVLAAAALSAHERGQATRLWASAVAFACALAGLAAVAAAAVVVVAAAISRAKERRDAARALLLLASVPYLGWQLADDTVRERAQHLGYHALVAEMRARGLYRDEPLFVDLPIARYDRHVEATEVHTLANAAIAWETRSASNPRNGQREALLVAADRSGILLDPERHEVRRDAVYALADRERTRGWRERLESAGFTAAPVQGHLVYRFDRAPRPAMEDRGPSGAR